MKKVLYIKIGVLLIVGLSSSLQSMEGVNDQEKGILTCVKETAKNTINGFGNISIWNSVRVHDFLPFAIVAYCFNEYPKQTFVVFGGLLMWCLSKTEKGNKLLQKFKDIVAKSIGISDESPTVCNEKCVDLPVNINNK